MEVKNMKKNSNLTSAKEAVKSTAEKVIKSTEEKAEAAIKVASNVVKKENVEKTINVMKDTAKNVKSKATKAATAATTVATTAAKKTRTKKVDVAFYVQYQGKEISKHAILEKIHDEWVKSHKLSELKTVDIYFKVEDDTAYCLVNGEINIDLKLS